MDSSGKSSIREEFATPTRSVNGVKNSSARLCEIPNRTVCMNIRAESNESTLL